MSYSANNKYKEKKGKEEGREGAIGRKRKREIYRKEGGREERRRRRRGKGRTYKLVIPTRSASALLAKINSAGVG